jgi:hypothetical protein
VTVLLVSVAACSSSHSAPPPPVPAAKIQASLVTASDIGMAGGLDEAVPASSDPLPCAAPGSKSVNAVIPASSRAGVIISSDALQAAYAEEVRVFKDKATADRALNLVEAGFGCKTGHLAGNDGGDTDTLNIKSPVSILSQLTQAPALSAAGIRSAEVWHAGTNAVQIALVAVTQGRELILISYQSGATPSSKLESVADVIQKSIEKVIKT